MTNVLVLGATGMLGSMVARVLGAIPDFDVFGTIRGGIDSMASSPDIELLEFDASRDPVEGLVSSGDFEWIINAIGIIKPRIAEDDPASVARAIAINAAFPHRLAAALRPGQRVIQIATDAVFSGASGPYDEISVHDGATVYGRSKSLGETPAPGFVHLRCSIIGPELGAPVSLLGWALSQPRGARIKGYVNQRWNGITTLHFARLCSAVIGGKVGAPPSPLHVVPADTVSKAELLALALAAYGRADVEVEPCAAPRALDFTLSTTHETECRRLWAAAGHAEPPSIRAMIVELAGYPLLA